MTDSTTLIRTPSMNDVPAHGNRGRATLAPATPRRPAAEPAPVKLSVRGLDFHYGAFHAIKGVSMEIPEKRVSALIGPSGCGKSTLLRVFNRIYALYPGQVAGGSILLDGEDILSRSEERRVGKEWRW